ncbi:MAG: tRNA pseudouridine(38-40) synthase TruA [Chloroflexi bacterium]|nr:tRNA pseudouridine(38-40) synthase TruA [Chloroflexota bacterium]
MKRYAAILAYDGTDYQGFQRQPAPTPTIQAAVEAAVAAVTRRACAVVGAGRTDTGVHALGQVIAFDVDWKHSESELMSAINASLPLDIALQRLWRQDDFHPRYDARWRQYAYRVAAVSARNPLLNRSAWQLVGAKLNLDAMRKAAACCLGEHDFAAFGTPPQPGSGNTVRQIFQSRWETASEDYGAVYSYRIRGTAFLYHMVRRLVGVMVQVGRGRLSLTEFDAILRSRDIERAKVLAPPQGLVLEAVGYAPDNLPNPTCVSAATATDAPLEERI